MCVCVCVQISKAELTTSDIERLMVSQQMHVDVVRRVGRRVCRANRAVLQQADDPSLVGCDHRRAPALEPSFMFYAYFLTSHKR